MCAWEIVCPAVSPQFVPMLKPTIVESLCSNLFFRILRRLSASSRSCAVIVKKSDVCRRGITRRCPSATGNLSSIATTRPKLSITFPSSIGKQNGQPSTKSGFMLSRKSVSSLLLFARLHSSHKAWRFDLSLLPPRDLDLMWSTCKIRSFLVAPHKAHRPFDSRKASYRRQDRSPEFGSTKRPDRVWPQIPAAAVHIAS